MQNSVELCSSERLLQPLCNPYVNYGQLCFWLFTISFYGKMTGLLMGYMGFGNKGVQGLRGCEKEKVRTRRGNKKL